MSTEERSEAPESPPSYHDLYVTTAEIERTRLFDLSYGYEVTCTRVGGWSLWRWDPLKEGRMVKVAGEFDRAGLRLDVAGHVLCDSLSAPVEAGS